MNWPPLDTLLPAPRDDEPQSLRKDLMDEVRDHLQSAYLGELLKTPDPVQAEKNVLARFGDPAKIVRQLWFQAMQEKIMSQRVLVGTCLVMALASLAGVGMIWNLNQQNQTAMLQSQRELIASVEQNQKSNLQLLQTFMTEQKNLTSKADPEWCPVKIRCSLGKKGGPPAKGFVVSFYKRLETSNAISLTNLTVPDDGLVDLGLLQFGKYDLTVSSPAGTPDEPRISYKTSGELEILPRLPQVPLYGEYVCPESPPAEVSIKPQVIWPESLRRDHLWLLCTFSSQWDVEGRKWDINSYPNPNHPWANPQLHSQGGGGFGGGGGMGGFGGGGFGWIDLNPGGIGYCNVEDNLQQHIRPTTFGSHSWQCLINDRGEVWDLGFFQGMSVTQLLTSNEIFGHSLPKFETTDRSTGQTSYGQIIRQYSEPANGSDHVQWPAGELRLESIEVYSAPHQRYGHVILEAEGDQNAQRWVEKPIAAQDLLGSFRVQTVANAKGLEETHPLCKFRGLPGRENSLEITIPDQWVTLIEASEQKKIAFHLALDSPEVNRLPKASPSQPTTPESQE